VKNRLLATLSAADFALVYPHLEEIILKRGDVIGEPHIPFKHVYFPESAITSVVATTPDGHQIEVGIFGREGMSATSVLLGVDQSPHDTFVQVEGNGLRMPIDTLRQIIAQSTSLHQHLLRYVQVFNVQVAHTALSHGGYTIQARLARWLLMCHDRLDGNDLPLVHDFLALMLGVRRPGVTEQLHYLEGMHAIRARRGVITVLSRDKLLALAAESYGVPELEYERIIGPVRAE
jgi:CRP-like cAMP-binding protein